MKRINDVLNRKVNKIRFFVLFDILALFLTSILSLWTRFDFKEIPVEYLSNTYVYILFDLIIMVIIFGLLKLYTSMWTYASIIEFLDVVVGCLLLEIGMFLYKWGFNINMPRSYYIIQFFLMVILVGGVRFSFRIVRALIIKRENKHKSINTMIIGAGAAGRSIIEELENNRSGYDNRILCIIDDNSEKYGNYIRGIPIVGSKKVIKEYALKYDIKEIIIAIPSASKNKIAQIVDECQKTKCNIKILPPFSKLLNDQEESSNLMVQVRPLSYEDFLGRNEIIVNTDEIENNIFDKVALVTGGGGSIGSELCRQIAKYNPKMLIIFDIYENNAYEIEQELIRNYPNLNLKTIIGSVRDYDRLEKVFIKYNPTVIFHAAAHKHVPLMEDSPNEAIKNNCLGTLNCVKLADKYKVKKFVLISTDKAVNPTNIMGASKRICEMIVQTYNKISKTDYVAVRFGNVLGSNGSVIPLFLKQIDCGGPVTVTHKDITRFFMTIPEAVNLILQAYTYASGGEIFVLDMGKPVKIYDLAKKLIRYKGLEPGVDIDIKITGLRPGEKLYEEILMDEEGLKETKNKLIHIGSPIKIESNFLEELDALIEAAYKNDTDIKEKVAKIVETYKIDKREKNAFNNLKLMYITNDEKVALIAEKYGVDRVWIDLETLGKEERQKGMNTVKSNHCIDDIRRISKVLTKSELLVRVNPINELSEKEINDVIESGADLVMLPMWKSAKEVELFIKYINKRAKVILLLETKEAVECLDEVLKLDGIDEIHIGLNDLHLSYNLKFMFELLSNGLVEELCKKIEKSNIPYGFGGIAKIGYGTLPAEKIIMEHYRLGSTRAILSRSFCNTSELKNIDDIEEVFKENMKKLREYEDSLNGISYKDFLENKKDVSKLVAKIVDEIEKKN